VTSDNTELRQLSQRRRFLYVHRDSEFSEFGFRHYTVRKNYGPAKGQWPPLKYATGSIPIRAVYRPQLFSLDQLSATRLSNLISRSSLLIFRPDPDHFPVGVQAWPSPAHYANIVPAGIPLPFSKI